MGKYKIGIYAICKNEEQFVDRWVDSMQEADVIVVCDTGSTDHTMDRLKSRGVLVYQIEVKPWRFDVPRNIAMDYLPEDVDICVSTDLDEIFEVGWRAKIEAAWKPETTRLQYSYTSYYYPDGTPGATYIYEKIHKRFGFRWFKPVHELLEYSGDQPDCYARDESIHLMHHPDPSKPRTQYLNLLELSMKEYPNDDRNMHYLGREYMFHGMYQEAIETLKRHLSMPEANWPEERCASMRFIAICYQRLHRDPDAVNWLYRALGEAPNRREPYLTIVRYAYEHQNWSLAYAMTVEALKITDRPWFYLDDPACWDHTFYDIAGLSCYFLGLYEQSCDYTRKAIELAPNDRRLKDNLTFAEDKLRKITANSDQKQEEQVEKKNTINKIEQKFPKVAIVILTYQNLDYTKKCVQSIRTYTNPTQYELIIVDNGSTDGTREWLVQQNDIKYLLNDQNEGFPKGCNLGASLADENSSLLFLNNDTEVSENWLNNLNIALYNDELTGAVGPATSYDFYGVEDELGPLGFKDQNIARIQAFASKNNKSDPKRWDLQNELIGFCMLIKRKAWDAIGNFDERFTPGTYEDTDYSVRLLDAGYHLVLCKDCYVHHYGSRSFHHKTKKYQELLNKNSYQFAEKWNFRAEEMRTIKSYLIRMIEETDRPMNILDYHCGFGKTLLSIKNRYPQAQLFGIDEEKHQKVTGAFSTFSSRLEFPLEIPEHSMDYILIDDELEKCKDPSDLLVKFRNYLKPDGCVIGVMNNPTFFRNYRLLSNEMWAVNEQCIFTNNDVKFGIKDIVPFCESCGYKNTFLYHWFEEPSQEERLILEDMCKRGGKENEPLYKTSRISYKFRNNSL